MNGNDHYDDRPRRARRPDPLTDPWPPPWDTDAAPTGARAADYEGRGYRDEYGVGHRRGTEVPRQDGFAWQPSSATQTTAPTGGAEPLDGTERPRGRRRRPGPADTGSFPFPVSEAEALREQPRGRRRRPESDESARWAPESDPLFDGRGAQPAGPRSAERYDQPPDPLTASAYAGRRARSAHPAEYPQGRGTTPLRDEQRPGTAWSDDPLWSPADPGSRRENDDILDGRTRRRQPSADEDRDIPRRGRRARPPAFDEADSAPPRGRRSRTVSPQTGETPTATASLKTRETDLDDEDSDALPFPFTEDEDDEAPPRRSRRGRHSGRRAAGRRAKSRRQRKKSKVALASALIVLSLFLVSAGTGGYLLLRTYIIPPDYSGEGNGEVDIVIEEGDSGTVIAEKLHQAGVIASVRAFTNEIRFSDINFVPGTYRMRLGMSAEAAVALLLDPESRIALNVTIPEGLRAEQILDRLAEQTGIPREEFQEAYEDHESLDLPEYATQGPEGYLFPETYEFDRSASATEILQQMVAQYRKVAAEIDLENRAAEAGFDPNEIMAIAAIVQAESGKIEDMGKVARVIYNRLDDGMYLKMDSTCFYALGEYGIAINRDQQDRCRNDETGYDTYFHEGLPVGPIVSPGKDAIEAALAPEEGPWLFFVTTDPENGVTKFTDSEAEFWELVNEFNQSQSG
ncbi:MAG UNVERIFIED_CONTAM: endolytic transglycosylase MltG [Thermobifida fusca]